MSDSTQLLRQWKLLQLLADSRVGIPIAELTKQFEISDRNMRRDIALLKAAGFELQEVVGDRGVKRWKMKPFSEQLQFNYADLIAVVMSRRFLEPLAGTPFWEGHQKIYQKVRGALGENAFRFCDKLHRMIRITGFGTSDYSKRGQIIDTIAARSITHPGWGIDMVAADADLISATEAAALPGERWSVANSGGVALRVPTAGTLEDLMRKHTDFLNRLSVDGFKPVPPLREFGVQHYRRSWGVEPRPYVVFTILKPDASGNRAFSTPRRTRDVAAWIRHAVADVCRDWPDVASFVHGHGVDGKPNNSPNSSYRFQYLPLPTINSKLGRVDSPRNGRSAFWMF